MIPWSTTTQGLIDLRQGRSTAWESFYRTVVPSLVRWAQSHGLSAHQAEDLAQESLTAFFQAVRAGRYDPRRARLRQWLFGFARRVLLQQRRQQRHNGADAVTADRPANPASPTTDRLTWQTQWQRVLLQQGLERIRRHCDPRQFTAFERVALRGESADAVARDLRMSRNAVYLAKHRILGQLRQWVARLDPVDGAADR